MGFIGIPKSYKVFSNNFEPNQVIILEIKYLLLPLITNLSTQSWTPISPALLKRLKVKIREDLDGEYQYDFYTNEKYCGDILRHQNHGE